MNRNSVVFKETSEDWCSSYFLNDGSSLVCISCSGPVSDDGVDFYIVSAWGDDDLGLEFVTEFYAEAFSVFTEILELETVTFAALEEIGLTGV